MMLVLLIHNKDDIKQREPLGRFSLINPHMIICQENIHNMVNHETFLMQIECFFLKSANI